MSKTYFKIEYLNEGKSTYGSDMGNYSRNADSGRKWRSAGIAP